MSNLSRRKKAKPITPRLKQYQIGNGKGADNSAPFPFMPAHAMSSLKVKLAGHIGSSGRITFRDFMQAALYDSEFGYYNTKRPKIGPSGDYCTSSNVHSAFGSVLADCFIRLLAENGANATRASNASEVGARAPSSQPLNIIEIGAGTGQLAVDLITYVQSQHSGLCESLTYTIVDISRAMMEIQKRALAGFSSHVTWTSLPELQVRTHPRGLSGIIFSNELIDALPVHVVRAHRGDLQELYVASTARAQTEYSDAAEIGPRTVSTVEGLIRGEWGNLSTN
ncbi:MAG TPA: SAM-dependent methyltransferase, partial [Blastocatellia bacterium]